MHIQNYREDFTSLLLLNLVNLISAEFQSDAVDDDEEYDIQSYDESVWILSLLFFFLIKVFLLTCSF